MGERDPREILGLPSGASEDDLKDAYRRLALRYHPDRNQGDATAAAKFREASEAYAALRPDRRRPGASCEGVAAGASGGFAFAADSGFEFASPGGANTIPDPSWQIPRPTVGTARPGIPDHIRSSGGRTARRSTGVSASLGLVFGGVLIGVALPPADAVFGTHRSVWTTPLASSTSALAQAADATDFAAAGGPPERLAIAAVEDAPGVRCVAPAEDAPAGAAVLPIGGAPQARAETPVADVSAEDAAALLDDAAAEQAPARPEEPTRGQAAARAAGALPGQGATLAEHSSGDPVARPGPPPTLAGTGTSTAGGRTVPPAATAEAAAKFAILMRTGEMAMELGDVVGARARYERAAALDPASSTAAIASGETYDPHVLSLIRATNPWFYDAAKAAAWYERARALGDPTAIGLLARLR